MKLVRTRIISIVVFVMVVAGLMPLTAFAAEGALTAAGVDTQIGVASTASGTWGKCKWSIDANGVLTIHPGKGEDTRGISPWLKNANSVKKVVFAQENGKKVVAPADCRGLLSTLSKMESVDLSGLDTSKATDISRMFFGCPALKSADLTGLDASSVENMSAMFNGCNSLEELSLSAFKNAQPTNIGGMFNTCISLKSLDLSKLNTTKATNTDQMFDNCAKLERVVLGAKVTKLGDLPSEKVNGNAKWSSKKANKQFTSAQIAKNRLGIADTYVKPKTASQKVVTTNKSFAAKAKVLTQKNVTIKASEVVKGNKAKTELTYKKVKVSVKAAAKKFVVKSNGKIVLKKGLKKGVYKVTIKASAASAINYKTAIKYKAARKNFTVKVTVK